MTKAIPQSVNQAAFGALTNGVTLMQANFSDHAFERHSHDCFAIGTTTHGVQRFRCKAKQYDSQVGEFVLFNPDDDHDGRPGTADGFRYTIWYLPKQFVAGSVGIDGAPTRSRYFSRPHIADPEMAARFTALSNGLRATSSESLRVESLMQGFVGAMLCRHGEWPQSVPTSAPDAPAGALARVKDYIRTHYAEDIRVADLAAVAGLSRVHLTRAFGAAYHTPPHVYLNAVRIAQAQARIGLGMPLSMVALECGFADQSHLTRRFKGAMGIAPAAWRRANASYLSTTRAVTG